VPKIITITWRGQHLHFVGGPYRERIAGTFGVLLAPELRSLDHDYLLAIPDFGVPTAAALEEGIAEIVSAAMKGKVPYIGCFGGIGRTGLVLAAIHRVLDPYHDALLWVRREYLAHAVERPAQEKLIFSISRDRVVRLIDEKRAQSAFLSRLHRRFRKLLGRAV
jgi:hypothetical protein